MSRIRLGIVVTHPIQYQVPLFRYLAARSSIDPLVFFLSEHGLAESFDPGFGRAVKYDVPLLGGYQHRIVRNLSPKPSVGSPWGTFNPALPILLRRSRVDGLLVHGYSSVSHWLAFATATMAGIPYLLRGESRPDQRGIPWAKATTKRLLLKPLIQNAGACLAIGADNRAFYASYGAQPDRIFSAPYSVDTERFSVTGAAGRERRTSMLKALGLKPEIPLVLFAAKLLPRKRPLDVVLAMDQIEHPANLIIIGDGPLRHRLEDMAGHRPWMRVLGFINQRDIAKWYGAADLFVLPSSHEPWGLAVNEAMAAGAVPIVSESVGCARDLVTPEVGWVHGTGDTQALGRAIAEGCCEHVLIKRRAAAQQRSAEYGIAATASGIESAVTAALGW